LRESVEGKSNLNFVICYGHAVNAYDKLVGSLL